MRILVFLILYSISFAGIAQSTSVLFEVNMNEQINLGNFNSNSDFVDIAGSFNGWGDGGGLVLTDEDANGIYEGSLTLNIGQNIEYKARINGEWNGLEEFAGGGPNRSHTVVGGDVISFWYNDEVADNVLAIDISASAYFGTPGQVIQFTDHSSGQPLSWSWTFEGGTPLSSNEQNPIVTYTDAGTFNVSLTIINAANESINKTFENLITIGNTDTYWWNETVFYEIFVRSFYDANGDGKGDFKGLIEKLDYLNDGNPATHNDLGITGIWLMPIQESPSYHGYDVTDYLKIEPDYGSNEDFKLFVEEAHKRGIKVIIDYVMNHSSSEHPWFVDSKNPSSDKRDWYVWSENNPGGTGPWGQQVWHNSGGDYYYGIFWGGMPDLNYNTAALKQEMFDISTFWLEDMNVDGFRLDAVKYIFESNAGLEDLPETFDFWQEFRAHYKSIKPEAFAVGEAWTSTPKASKYVTEGGLDYVFEFDLASAIINVVQSKEANAFNQQMQLVMSNYPYLQFGTFLTNHDINRIMDVLGNDAENVKMAANLLFTIPGIPYIYYGEEIGMRGTKPDEDIRRPMQWDDSPAAGFSSGSPWRDPYSDYQNKNVAQQQFDTTSLWHSYHEMISIRNNQKALQLGNYKEVNNSSSAVVSFLRQYENEHLLILQNLSSQAVNNISIDADFSLITPGNYTLVDLKSGIHRNVTVEENESFNLNLERIEAESIHIFKFLEAAQVKADVTLMIDMNEAIDAGKFDPASETVDLVSNANEMGANLVNLSDEDKDGIYTVLLNDISIGSRLLYKYRINGMNDERSEFPDSDYLRSYRIAEGEQAVLDTYNAVGIALSNKTEFGNDLNIYPNPAKNILFIEIKELETALHYQLFDLHGTLKLRGNISNPLMQISLHDIENGLYFLQISGENKSETKKLLIRH